MNSITKTTYAVDELLLDGNLHNLLQECVDAETHLRHSVPDEILFTQGGEPNVRNRYGAMLMQIRVLRVTLRGFLDG